ncbi:MAG: hypothetical protein AAF449_18600 [Myxococcota bacterium]
MIQPTSDQALDAKLKQFEALSNKEALRGIELDMLEVERKALSKAHQTFKKIAMMFLE